MCVCLYVCVCLCLITSQEDRCGRVLHRMIPFSLFSLCQPTTGLFLRLLTVSQSVEAKAVAKLRRLIGLNLIRAD